MRYRKCEEYTLILFVFFTSIFLSTFGNPFSDLEGEEIQFPFGNCKTYHLGGKHGYPLIEEKSLELEPVFAFYPKTEEPIALTFHVMFPEAIFVIKVQGTMITIEKCNKYGRQCQNENEEGVKHPDYIKAHQWNRVRLNLETDKLEIQIGDRKVLSKSMLNNDINLKDIHWRVISDTESIKASKTSQPEFLYLVQFQCPEFEDSSSHTKPNSFTTNHSYSTPYSNYLPTSSILHQDYEVDAPTSKPFIPRAETTNEEEYLRTFFTTEYYSTLEPHSEFATGDEHPKESFEGKYVGLIVGLVVAAIIIVALVIVIYNVIKKRRSHNLTETSPLSPEQQVQETKN